jgi:hypothetical protein
MISGATPNFLEGANFCLWLCSGATILALRGLEEEKSGCFLNGRACAEQGLQ